MPIELFSSSTLNRRNLLIGGLSLGLLPMSALAEDASRLLHVDAPAEPALYATDYALERRNFRTALLRKGPSPDQYEPLTTPSNAQGHTYRSGDGGDWELRAWVSIYETTPSLKPAVLFLHGGNSLGHGHWDLMSPYIAAGYVVMMPAFRGENGQNGHFSGFYHEAADAVAAGDYLAHLPGVDPARVYLAGHSVGGTLTHLAAMMTPMFRAAVPISGNPNAFRFFQRYPEDIRFDFTNPREFEMRSALCFPGSYKCPVHLMRASEEHRQDDTNALLISRAKSLGREIGITVVEGNHNSALPGEIVRTIDYFKAFG